MTIVR